MKKTTKVFIFVVALICNTAFLVLCGYGKIHHEETVTYWDPILGIAAVLVLACGNISVIVQLYLRSKYCHLKRRIFDWKFWRQCILLTIYYIGSVFYLSVMRYDFMVSYLSIFAIALSPLWLLGGSRTLWWSQDGGESYFLDDFGKWYEVRGVMENEDMVEIKCTPPDGSVRSVTIEKRKQRSNIF